MISKQVGPAGGGGLFPSDSVASATCGSTNTGVSSVMSRGIAMAPVILVFWLVLGELDLLVSPSI